MKFLLRKKKLINSGLQLKMIVGFLFLACIASLFQVILLNRSIFALSRHMPTDGDILLAELPNLLVGNMVVTLGVLLPVMFGVGVLITHRIAGPIYRFERHLESIARGEAVGVCRIRAEDELHDLCDKINAAVAHLRMQAGPSTQPAGSSAGSESDASETSSEHDDAKLHTANQAA